MATQSRISDLPLSVDAPARDHSSSPAPGGGEPLVVIGQGAYQTRYTPNVRTVPTPWLITEPASVYHAKAKDNLSSHALADFRHCPRIYRDKQLGLIKRKDTPAFRFGRAAHTLILEGRDRFESQFVIINTDATSNGREAISCRDASSMLEMASSVHSNIFARELLSDGIAEGVIRCKYSNGMACQARLDWLNPDPKRGIVDLKTCRNIDEFETDCRIWHYIHQLAFYRSMVVHAGGYVPSVHIIAVEKEHPYRCGVWAIGHNALTCAMCENAAAMVELHQCRQTDTWPTRYESMRLIDRL